MFHIPISGLNAPTHYGQHYAKRSLRPGRSIFKPGMCNGLSLAWLRGVFLGHGLTHEPRQFEAMLMQSAMFGNATRSMALACAHPYDWTARFSQSDHSSWLFGHLDRLGLSYPRWGRLNGAGVASLIAPWPNPQERRGFMMSIAGHVIAVAVYGDHVGLFDSDSGISIYSRTEAATTLALANQLTTYLVEAGAPWFEVLEVGE